MTGITHDCMMEGHVNNKLNVSDLSLINNQIIDTLNGKYTIPIIHNLRKQLSNGKVVSRVIDVHFVT